MKEKLRKTKQAEIISPPNKEKEFTFVPSIVKFLFQQTKKGPVSVREV
jgi:hypothetical protein